MTTLDKVIFKAMEGEYGEDSRLIGKLAGLVRTSIEGGGPFICGDVGPKGEDGLRPAYLICPMFGADHRLTAVYKRSDQ